jgi:hypothetical protein
MAGQYIIFTIEQGGDVAIPIEIQYSTDGVSFSNQDITGAWFSFTAKQDINTPDATAIEVPDWQEIATPTTGMTWLMIPNPITNTMAITNNAPRPQQFKTTSSPTEAH